MCQALFQGLAMQMGKDEVSAFVNLEWGGQ